MSPAEGRDPRDVAVEVALAMDALRETELTARWEAVALLTSIGGPARDELRLATFEADRMVRYLSVTALGWIGDARDGELLARRGGDDIDPEVRYAALVAMDLCVPRRLPETGEDPAFVTAALDKARADADPEVQALAVVIGEQRADREAREGSAGSSDPFGG